MHLADMVAWNFLLPIFIVVSCKMSPRQIANIAQTGLVSSLEHPSRSVPHDGTYDQTRWLALNRRGTFVFGLDSHRTLFNLMPASYPHSLRSEVSNFSFVIKSRTLRIHDPTASCTNRTVV